MLPIRSHGQEDIVLPRSVVPGLLLLFFAIPFPSGPAFENTLEAVGQVSICDWWQLYPICQAD